MFAKILIANRGEIACRVIRTARRMGIATVAVYCDVDRSAPHVEMADEAIGIGPPPASTSYLVVDRIIDACRTSGAEAVHPGYGFLSERADFAEALAEAGIVFIGPNARAIAAMGDKIQSKKLAASVGVSTVPGHPQAVDDVDTAVAAARAVGLPVMIKASAGGGGKGMRIVRCEAELAENVARARSEARSSFGDDRILIETFIDRPRHIEIQVLADRHGKVVHLGERECSIQRRHQKIVEEAPSPAVGAALRAEMGAQAVALARAVGYDSAGTVEFVMDGDGRFYFLEMNTRLQVEHPVTELVTGVDMVEQMIRVAAGEPLGFAQDDIRLDGWAIEARLYAEDPTRDFLPSIGRLDRYRPPPPGADGAATVRIDDGVAEGSEVSVYFDPLIAKLVTHGPDRTTAADAMAAALDRFVVDGIAHNRLFLTAVVANRRWRQGDMSTDFIIEEFPDGFTAAADAATRDALAMVALAIELRGAKRSASPFDGNHDTWREDWVVSVDGERRTLRALKPEPGSGARTWSIVALGASAPVAVVSDWRPGDPLWLGTVGGAPMAVQVRRIRAGLVLSCRGAEVLAKVMPPHVAALDALMVEKPTPDSARRLRCPMPGLVVAIDVAVGQKVRAGEPLAVVEAMKMENVLRAGRDATVARILVAPGDILAVDAVIMEFE